MVRQANAQLGPVDVLVNNAGTITVGPMEVMTLEDYELAMKTHFWAPLYATLAVLPQMRQRRAGRIVNISSIGGKVAAPHLLPYTASKFALTGLSDGMRLELLKDGIYVTTVCPGLMRTGSPRNALFKGRHRAEYAWFSIADSLPLTSMSADRAARRILRACRDGESEVVLSIQAKLAVKFHALFPGLTTDLNGLIAKLLPGPGGIGETAVPGRDSTSEWSPSWMTGLTERAAEENNETAGRTAGSEPAPPRTRPRRRGGTRGRGRSRSHGIVMRAAVREFGPLATAPGPTATPRRPAPPVPAGTRSASSTAGARESDLEAGRTGDHLKRQATGGNEGHAHAGHPDRGGAVVGGDRPEFQRQSR